MSTPNNKETVLASLQTAKETLAKEIEKLEETEAGELQGGFSSIDPLGTSTETEHTVNFYQCGRVNQS